MNIQLTQNQIEDLIDSINFVCAECGNPLGIWEGFNRNELKIDPCEHCVDQNENNSFNPQSYD